MFDTTERFITQMKLRELRKQRQHLLEAYDALRQRVAEAPDNAERLRRLYAGLQELTFAQQPIHPDVMNLNILLQELVHQPPTSALLDFWLEQLERELARGRLRSEFVYIFGALLEEWMAGSTADPDGAEKDAYRQTMLQRLAAPAATDGFAAVVDVALSELHSTDIAPLLQETHVGHPIRHKVEVHELEVILSRLKGDLYRSSQLRQQAGRFLDNQALFNEFCDALTILLENLEDWSWAELGVPARVVWMRTRWRLLLDEDLTTACLLEILGERWQAVLNQLFDKAWLNRLFRLRHLLELKAPPVIMENELRMLKERGGFQRKTRTVDIWSDSDFSSTLENETHEAMKRYIQSRWGADESVLAQHMTLATALEKSLRTGNYSQGDSEGRMRDALKLLNADIQVTRTALPNRPIYLIKFDLQDFYPSLSHDLLLHLLAKLHVPERDMVFFRRFLRVPIAGLNAPAQSGLPINCGLSHTLAGLLLGLMDHYIQQAARVNIVRLVDDVCLMTLSADEALKAWNAVQTFCAACGLTMNPDKSGALCIGGEPVPGLPTTRPTWMMLSPDDAGNWQVDEAKFQAFLDQTRGRVQRAPSIIARVEEYNAGLELLLNAIGIDLALGDTHRRSLEQAVARFHYAFSAPAEGIVQSLSQRIRDQLLNADASVKIPEAWLYWPITAGGLGLHQPMVQAARYAHAFKTRQENRQFVPPQQIPEDWHRRKNDWSNFYKLLLTPLPPVDPQQSDVMETLVKDFIERGNRLSGGKQTTLSSYWRWILYTYGAQILERFGTFRFLIMELVPVQLILQKRQQAAPEGQSQDGEAPSIPF